MEHEQEHQMNSLCSEIIHGLDKRVALLEQSYSNITKELHNINNNLSRLVWTVAIGIVAAATNFVIRGGLASLGT